MILECEQKILNQSVRNLHLILKKKNSHKCVAVLLCNTLNDNFVVISMQVRPEMVFDFFGENILDKSHLGL